MGKQWEDDRYVLWCDGWFWREGEIASENCCNGIFIQNWVGRTRENGQHDNGHVIQLLMDNGPLGVIWQVMVTKVYGRLTWRFVIGDKVTKEGCS